MTVGWRDHAEYLTAHLVRSGELRTEAWIEAFASVPRHMFVPGFYDLSAGEHVDGADPAVRERWLRSVYSDEPLVTQVRRQHQGLKRGSRQLTVGYI